MPSGPSTHQRLRRAGSPGRSRSRSWAWAALAALLVSPGCVTRGSHDLVVAERDQLTASKRVLEERVVVLEAANQSLENERVGLIAEGEQLSELRGVLERDVSELRSSGEVLEQSLKQREAELRAKAGEVQKLKGTFEGLVQDLESEVSAGQIEIERLREGIRLSVSDEILFASGSARLGADGAALLAKVAGRLRGIDQRIEVQGHSDSVPIHGKLTHRYPTNWELAGARAARVVRLLQEAGVAGPQLTAVSYGPHHPVVPNDTPENRSLNRRIEIRLLPPVESSSPAAAPSPPAES